LIAIVSDSYERIMESKERSNLKQQVEMTTEFLDFISFNRELTSKDYLCFVEPVEDENQIQNWEGGIKFIERTTKMQEKKLKDKLEKMQE
jgi:hypothetical protein